MGTKGREIVGKHADRLIELLNKAFADEWLAYYQYWVGAKVVSGPMKDAVIAELTWRKAAIRTPAPPRRVLRIASFPVTVYC